jgi:hypothetical protein
MKYLLSFVVLFAAFTVATISPAFAAKSAKSEPAPVANEDQEVSNADENAPGSFEETYEGNGRGGDEFEGMDLFSAKPIKTVTEDRGAVIVVTTTRARDAYPEDTCAFITVQTIDKKSGEVLGSNTISTCQEQIL